MTGLREIDESLFGGKYWNPTQGKQHTLDIVASCVMYTDFGGKEKEKKPVIEVDIVNIDGQRFDDPVKFSTGAISFVKDFVPINNEWYRAGQEKIRVMLRYSSDKRYTVLDLTEQLADPKVVEEAMK